MDGQTIFSNCTTGFYGFSSGFPRVFYGLVHAFYGSQKILLSGHDKSCTAMADRWGCFLVSWHHILYCCGHPGWDYLKMRAHNGYTMAINGVENKNASG